MEAPTVTIGTETVTLCKPGTTGAIALARSDEDRKTDGHEIGIIYGAAALRMCWPEDAAWPVLMRPLKWRPGVPMAVYGAEVLDGLGNGDIDVVGMLPALQVAYDWAITSRLLQAEVRAAEDFSAPPPGA